MQIHAALYNHQTKSCTRAVTDVMTAVKSVKEPLSVGFWNSGAFVADGAK
jgi:hypothetical protein